MPGMGTTGGALAGYAQCSRIHRGVSMSTSGRVAALGLAVLVGALGGVLVTRASNEPQVITTTAAAGPVTVTLEPSTVMVTTTVEPAPNEDPAGPKANGNYLVGAELAAGTWQCSKGAALTSWYARDRDGQVTADWGAGTLAVIPADAYIADLLECSGTWARVG